jgi:hypothetical protein
MTTKRKIRKYIKMSPNPRKRRPRGGTDEIHFDVSKYYNLDELKVRSPKNENFSHLQKNHPNRNRLDNLFETTIERFLDKSPFERDAVSFYRYGVFFRSQSALPNDIISKVRDQLVGTKGTLSVIHEQKSDALLVRFGNNSKMLDADQVTNGLQRRQHEINEIYDILRDYGDVYWGLEFETEEELY